MEERNRQFFIRLLMAQSGALRIPQRIMPRGWGSSPSVIVVAHNKYLSICCLARNDHTVSSPFISAIEVHRLDDSLYNSTDFKKYAMVTLARNSFGLGGHIIGYEMFYEIL